MSSLLPFLLLSCGPEKPGGGDGGSTLDCPTPSTWYVDGDGDGYGSGPAVGQSCVRPSGQVANAEDCDDSDAAVHPGGSEVCNGLDDDCDGNVDPSTAADVVTCWTDADGDRYGSPGPQTLACTCADGLADNDQDCDDDDPDTWPGAPETLYDGVDSDCMGLVGEYDRDEDGYDWTGGKGVDGTDCDDDDPLINPSVLDLCEDEVDQDCDGVIDECGLGELTDADDAWWQVYRDSDIRTAGWIGSQLAHGGDSDGDGRQEVLGPIVADRCDDGSDPACYLDYSYVLFEAPAGTSGGSFEVAEAAIAAWAVIDDPGAYWRGTGYTSDHNSIGDVDLDGDGIRDYIMGAAGAWSDSDLSRSPGPSRIDLWYGPPPLHSSLEEPQDLAEAQTIVLDTDVSFEGTVELLVPPEGGDDWVLAAGLWPPDDDLEGTRIPTVVLLTADHFNGTQPVDQAIQIWAEAPYGAGSNVEVGDVDGDGLRDLALGAVHWTHPLPAGRIWIAAGPVGSDLDLADATYIIDGDFESDFFGTTFSIVDDLDGDGRDEVVANQRYLDWEPEYTSVHIYSVPESGAPTSIAYEDAVATLQSINADGFEAYNSRFRAPRLVGDVDGDRTRELAIRGEYRSGSEALMDCVFLFDTPLSGTYAMSEFSGIITSDRDGGGLGASVLGGVDYDGDGWPDLVVDEYYWTGSPDDATPYGRFHVFRGAVGGS